MAKIITIFILALSILMVAFVLAAVAQERHGGRGGGWGGGGQHGGGGGFSRPTPTWSGRGGGRQYYRERHPGYTYSPGYGWYNPSAVVGGAIGGWLYRQFAQPEPPVVIVQQPAPEPYRTVGWCVDRYKSYDPYTRTYLGYDGYRHSCP